MPLRSVRRAPAKSVRRAAYKKRKLAQLFKLLRAPVLSRRAPVQRVKSLPVTGPVYSKVSAIAKRKLRDANGRFVRR